MRLDPHLVGALALLALTVGADRAARAQEPPATYQQILPRGQIASIDNPEWVGAAEAQIPDDSWVLGVLIDGEPRAFSINLLNLHEIVNDKIGDVAYAAVW